MPDDRARVILCYDESEPETAPPGLDGHDMSSPSDLEPDDDPLIDALCEIRPEQVDALARSLGRTVRSRLVNAAVEPFRIGRYTVLEYLGGGGMGTVFLAYDSDLDRKVALKVLRVQGEAGRKLVLREGRALARITHPRIVTVHEIGMFDEQVYMVMEHVRGVDLRQWLREGRDVEAIVQLLVEVARGLAAAHDGGIVHLDFKPEHVLIDPEGSTRVIDFGLARMLEESSVGPAEGSWSTPSRSGTPAYMAPERRRGELGDPRADQYSYCVVAWEALTGERPEGPDAVMPPQVKVPSAMVEALRRGLRADPRERFDSMHALVEVIAPRPNRRRLWLMGGVALALLVGAYGIGRGSAPTVPECGSPWPAVEQSWNDARAEALARSFRATEVPFAEATWGTVDSGLDRYAAAWTEAQTGACEAARGGGARAQATLDRRLACLEDRRLHLEALVDHFVDADAAAVTRAVEGLEGLPPIDACEDPEDVDASLWGDPQTADARARLRGALAQFRTAARLGSHEGLDATLDQLIADARALDHPVLLAEVLLSSLELGHNQAQDRLEQSIARAREALYLATVHAEPLLAANALLAIVQLRRDSAIEGPAEELLTLAEAMSERLGHPVGLESRIVLSRGALLKDLERSAEAVAVLEEGLGRLGDAGDRRWTIAVLGNLANCHTALGHYDRAEEAIRRALELGERILGPDHPWLGILHNSAGNIAANLGRLEQSITHLERSEAIAVANYGPDHPLVATAQANRAATYAEQGRQEAALQAYRASLATYERAEVPDHPDVSMGRCYVAKSLLALGRPDEALAEVEAAMRGFERVPSQRRCPVLWCNGVHGSTLVALGRAAEAVAVLEEPLAQVMQRDCQEVVRADLSLVMARARWAAEGEAARAAVVELLDGAPSEAPHLRPDVERLRAEMGRGAP